MSEKKVSVRLAAVGGQELKAQLRGIGIEGREALQIIEAATGPASSGMLNMDAAIEKTRLELEQLSARAATAASAMRGSLASMTPLQQRINAATGAPTGAEQSTAAILRQGQALDDLRAKYNPTFDVLRRYRQAQADIKAAHFEGAISTDEMTAAISRERQAALQSIAVLKGRTQGIEQMSRASRGATLRTQQMFYQVNDIGVSLAGGMNPFVVMAQQGTQIAQIYGFGNGGVSAIFRDLSQLVKGLVVRFWPLTLAIGAASAAIKGMQAEINETSRVTVTFGDTALAVWQVVRDRLWTKLRPAVQEIGGWFSDAWDAVTAATVTALNAVINGVEAMGDFIAIVAGAAFEAIVNSARSVPVKLEAVWTSVHAGFVGLLGDLQTQWSVFLMTLAKGFDRIPGGMGVSDDLWSASDAAADAAYRSATDAARLRDEAAGLRARGGELANGGDLIAQAIAEAMDKAAQTMAEDPLGGFFDEVKQRAIQNALKRTAEEAAGTGKAAKEAATGWAAMLEQLDEYVKSTRDIGAALGETIVGAFRSAEDAVGNFVKTGKLDFSDMVTSFLADMARLSSSKFIFGPLANALGGWMSGWGGGSGIFSDIGGAIVASVGSNAGGGYTGSGPRTGGLDGRGGFLTVMHPQERIYDEFRGQKAPANDPRPVVINVNGVRDAESFRRSRAQIAADLQRGLAMGGRTR